MGWALLGWMSRVWGAIGGAVTGAVTGALELGLLPDKASGTYIVKPAAETAGPDAKAA